MKHLNMRSLLFLITTFLFSYQFVSCKSAPTDEQIKNNVTDSLQVNDNTKAINVTVADGVVALSGECKGENCATNAEDKVKNMDGVKQVNNTVTMMRENTDLTLRTKVQSVLTNYEGVQADVANGVIVLRGTLNRSQLQPLMTELNALSPIKIDNELAIQ